MPGIAIVCAAILLLSIYASIEHSFATHLDIFIPVLEIEPRSPIAGQIVTITTVLTNRGNNDMSNVQVSYNVDGVWVIDDVHVDVPSRRSVQVSFATLMPVNPGEHQLKACPERAKFGDDGDQCRILNFIAIDESTIVVTILSPREESVLSGTTTIKIAALGQTAEKVELYVQNELADTKREAPFDFVLDTTKYEDGQYRIYAIAYYDSGIAKASSVKKFFIDNHGGNVIVTMKPSLVLEAQARVGQSLIIESDVTNEQPFKIAATFIVLVKDSNGYTEFITWKEDKIAANETLPMSQSWVPREKGRYTVNVFLWDTLENAVPLSDVMKAIIDVL
ncbi:MAG: Ig-like domain-containing protein [Nitrososphaerales archaeon]